jgi:hypothetical protein
MDKVRQRYVGHKITRMKIGFEGFENFMALNNALENDLSEDTEKFIGTINIAALNKKPNFLTNFRRDLFFKYSIE